MKHIKKYLSFVLLAVVFCIVAALSVLAITAIIAMLFALITCNFVTAGALFMIAIVSLFLLAAILDLAEWMNQKGWIN